MFIRSSRVEIQTSILIKLNECNDYSDKKKE